MNQEEVARRLSELRRGTGMTDAKLAAETRLMALVGAESASELKDAVIQTTELLLNQTQAACLRAALDPELGASLDARCSAYGNTIMRSEETVKKYSAIALKDLAASIYALHSGVESNINGRSREDKSDRQRIHDLEQRIELLIDINIKTHRALADQVFANAKIAVSTRIIIVALQDLAGATRALGDSIYGKEGPVYEKTAPFFDKLFADLNEADIAGDHRTKKYSEILVQDYSINESLRDSVKAVRDALSEEDGNSLRRRADLAEGTTQRQREERLPPTSQDKPDLSDVFKMMFPEDDDRP